MIRVLHIVMGMNRGGLETFIMNVYRNIDRNMVQFDFLVHTNEKCDYDDEIQALGGKILRVTSRRQGILKNRKILDRFFKENSEYDIVHQHASSLSYITPLKAAKRNGVPVRIIHGHSTKQGGSFLHKYIHQWNKFFIKYYATHFFACSDSSAKWMYSRNMYQNREFRLIKNAISTNKFKFNKNTREKVRENLNLKDKYVIGHVGRFSNVKNHEFLIDIFKELHDKVKSSVLLLVGDGELKSQIENKIKMLGLTDNVIFTGICSDVSEVLQAMDVFVFPSLYEGLGIALIEAQTAGLPCIVADTIPREAIIRDNVESVSLKEKPETWAKIILQYIDNSARIEAYKETRSCGYEIKEVGESLQNFYLTCYDILSDKN